MLISWNSIWNWSQQQLQKIYIIQHAVWLKWWYVIRMCQHCDIVIKTKAKSKKKRSAYQRHAEKGRINQWTHSIKFATFVVAADVDRLLLGGSKYTNWKLARQRSIASIQLFEIAPFLLLLLIFKAATSFIQFHKCHRIHVSDFLSIRNSARQNMPTA